jgi:hypothetical protein
MNSAFAISNLSLAKRYHGHQIPGGNKGLSFFHGGVMDCSKKNKNNGISVTKCTGENIICNLYTDYKANQTQIYCWSLLEMLLYEEKLKEEIGVE